MRIYSLYLFLKMIEIHSKYILKKLYLICTFCHSSYINMLLGFFFFFNRSTKRNKSYSSVVTTGIHTTVTLARLATILHHSYLFHVIVYVFWLSSVALPTAFLLVCCAEDCFSNYYRYGYRTS